MSTSYQSPSTASLRSKRAKQNGDTFQTLFMLCSPASTAFMTHFVFSERTYNNAFNRLSTSQTVSSHVCQIKEVHRSPTEDEACCRAFYSSEINRAKRQMSPQEAPPPARTIYRFLSLKSWTHNQRVENVHHFFADESRNAVHLTHLSVCPPVLPKLWSA